MLRADCTERSICSKVSQRLHYSIWSKPYFLSRTAKLDPKDGVSRPNFQ